MNTYTWAIDGFSRQFIVRRDDPWTIVMCCFPGCARFYVDELEKQDEGKSLLDDQL